MKGRDFLDTLGAIALLGCTATGVVFAKTVEIKLASGFAGAFALVRMADACEDRDDLELTKRNNEVRIENAEAWLDFSYRSNKQLRKYLDEAWERNSQQFDRHSAQVADLYQRINRVRREGREMAKPRVQILEARAKYWERAYRTSQRDFTRSAQLFDLESSDRTEPETETPVSCGDCSFYSWSQLLPCAVNPMGPSSEGCADFEA